MGDPIKARIKQFYDSYAPYSEEDYDYSIYSLKCILEDLRADNSNVEDRIILEQIIEDMER